MFYKFAKCVLICVYKLAFLYRAVGKENIPASGSVLLCCNHVSNFDPPAAGLGVKRQLRFMAKKELFDIPMLGALIRKLGAVPIDRKKRDIGAVRVCMEILKSGGILMMFPQGTRRKQLREQDFKPGGVLMAYKTRSAIVPVYTNGKYRFWGRLRIYYGKPIYPEEIDALLQQVKETEINQTLSKLIYERIHALAQIDT